MKRTLFFALAIILLSNTCSAQLNKLCPVSSKVYDAEKIKGMNLLLNTKDFVTVYYPNARTTRTSTLQLVNAAQPFPPLWFQMGNPVADTGNFMATTFLLDLRIQKSSGHLTFFNSYPKQTFASTTLDTATLQPIDTVIKYTVSPTDTMMQYLDLHDYQTDAAGNKLITNQVKRSIDARCLSGLEKDSLRMAVVNDIIILNPNDSIIFKWNPLDHLSVCEMMWEYKNSSLSYGEVINWSHINSARFANDGNIIYSLRHIGLGKISRTTGEIMWKLGGKDTANAIPLPKDAGYYLQHDFHQREDGLYSVFSNGDSSHLYLEGLVYAIDEVNKKATLVSRYRPQPELFSRALGSYECNGDTCVINFGMFTKKGTKESQTIGQILVGNKVVAEISTPVLNFSYQIHSTRWAALQRRPKVALSNGALVTDAKEMLHDFVWYKIESDTAIPVGNGLVYTPAVAGNYVVEAQQGEGLYRSYLISDVFTFGKKK